MDERIKTVTMYRLERSGQKYRENPWNRPYQDRIAQLQDARRCGRKTAAFLYPHFDSSTFRYRGYNIAETLEYSFWWSGSYFESGDVRKLFKDIDFVDVLVVIRCAWDSELDGFLKAVKAKGIRLCYDVDDLICHPGHMPSIISALGLFQEPEWNFWFGLTERNRMAVQLCDAIITTNGYLAQHLKADFQKPCYIIKNYLNWIQEEVSSTWFEAKMRMESQKPFEIGYFSGSPTHVKDLMVLMPEMETFLNGHENTVLKIVGYMELPEEYAYLEQKKKIRFVPFQTFEKLQYEQAQSDINVVPLVNNEFSNCKSELKYFESAIVGTITCATPAYTYAGAITHGENGFLCREGEWLPLFEKLYESGVHKQQQESIRKRALEQYAFLSQVKTVEHVLDDIFDYLRQSP